MNRISQQIKLCVCLIVPNILGLVTAIGNFSAIQGLLKTINKPTLSMPTFLYVILWIALYTAIGYATYLVVETRAFPEDKQRAVGFCACQLILHSFWVTCFFKYHWFLIGFLLHLLYLAVVFSNLMLYRQLNKQTNPIMFTYFGVVLYFTYLNFAVLFIN